MTLKPVSEDELKRLMQRAMSDRREEPCFFRALLDATVYAHVPISDDSGTIRFVQFVRPDNGQTVLPFFFDEAEAYATAGTVRKVVALQGRLLFQHTLGATLILDPNGTRCVLYPEEVKGLLSRGVVAQLDEEILEKDREVLLGPINSVPDWLEPIWSQLLPSLSYVENAYLVATAPKEDPDNFSLLVILGVAPEFAQRAGRALATALQARGPELKMAIDSTCYDPRTGHPAVLKNIDIEPIYVRTPP